MSTGEGSLRGGDNGRSPLPLLLIASAGDLKAWVRTITFWKVQGMIAFVTLLHYPVDQTTYFTAWYHFHCLVPFFYAVPIIVASQQLRFRRALATAVEIALVGTPYVFFGGSRGIPELLIDMFELSAGLLLGLVIAWVLQREAGERRRAEETKRTVSLLHQRLTEVQEGERQRLSRELHDVGAQSLVLLCRGLDRVTAISRLPGSAREQLHVLRLQVDEVLGDIRRLSRDLRPRFWTTWGSFRRWNG